MKPDSCLLNYLIFDNQIVSTCDFNPEKLNNGKVIYEVIRIIDGTPLFFKEHIERFLFSVSSSGFDILQIKNISSPIKELIELNKLEEGNIRFQVSYSDDNHIIFSAWVSPFFYPGKHLRDSGASLATIMAERENPNIKVHNPNLKSEASSIIDNSDIYEVLLVNQEGIVTEGSRSNIFFIKDNNIFTPQLLSVLPGITRSKVIDILHNLGIVYAESDITKDSLSEYNAAFITGTSPKILPVKNIDRIIYNTKHPLIETISNEYNRIIEENIESFSWAHYID